MAQAMKTKPVDPKQLQKDIEKLFKGVEKDLKNQGLWNDETQEIVGHLRNYLVQTGIARNAIGREKATAEDVLTDARREIGKLTEKENASRYGEAVREATEPDAVVGSFDPRVHKVLEILAGALEEYEGKGGAEKIFESGNITDNAVVQLLALGLVYQEKIAQKTEGIPEEGQVVPIRSGEEGPPVPAGYQRARPPREGDMRGHVARKEAGATRYPEDYWKDRGAKEISIEERIELAKKRLAAIEGIMKEYGISPVSLEKAESERKEMGSEGWRETEYLIAIGAELAKWEESIRKISGMNKEELAGKEDECRAMLGEIPQPSNLRRSILLAKDDAQKFNDMYEGKHTYFQTITPEWMAMMGTLTERINSRRESMRFFKEFYGALLHKNVKNLDVKLDSIEKMSRWESRMNQIYGELSGSMGGLEYDNLPYTAFLDPDTGNITIPEVSFNSETGEMALPDKIITAGQDRVLGNREMAMSSLMDFEVLMNAMFKDPATKPLAQRFFVRFYSKWHKDFAGKKMESGQEYKYYSESMRKLLQDSSFIAERQVLARVLGSAELKVQGPLGRAPEILDNETVATNFASLSLETQYEIVELAKKVGGEGMNPENLASLAVLINNLRGHSPAYSPLLVRGVGEQLITQFSPDQVNVISNYLMGFENVFVQTGQYADLEKWYLTLPSRMNEMFTTIRDIMKASREPGRDIRIRMPSEEDWVEIYSPAARMTMQVPKHTYYEWAMGVLDGMPDNAAVRALIAPDLKVGITRQPSSIITEQRFFEQGILHAEVLRPYAFIRIPITVENLGVLAPNIIPHIGPWHTARAQAATAYNYSGEFGETEDIQNLSLGEQVYLQGLGKDAMQRHLETISGDIRTSQGEVRARRIDDLSVGEGNTLWNADATYRVVHGTEADEEEIAVNSLAPKGADTAIYFKHTETEEGVDRYRAYIYQRFENGVFALVDYEDLEPAEAETMYNGVFREVETKDVVRKLYGETGVMGTGKDKTVIGDWRTSIDGCVLFAGNDDEFMVEEERPVGEEGTVIIDRGAMFQGVGGSLEKYNAGGGFGSYEHTREGRAATGGGRIDASNRSFAIGRIFARNLHAMGQEGTEDTGVQPPMRSLTATEDEPGYTDVEVDMWLLKDRNYNFRAFMNTLGIMEGDAKYGGVANYIGDGFYVGGAAKGRHDRGEWAGSAYGVWGREMANALVASTMVQTAGEGEEPYLGDLAAGSVFAIKSNLELQGIFAYHRDFNGNVLRPAERTPGAQQLGSLAKFIWDPVSERTHLERIEVLGAYYQRTEVEPDEETVRGGLGGGALEWSGPLPGTAEGYYPGMGELKLSLGNVDIVAGGGRTLFDSYGGHAGARVRLGRLTLFGVGAIEEEGPAGNVSEEAERARILDGMVGFRFLLSEPESLDQWRWQIFGGLSGITQQFEESGDPWQLDATLGMLGTDAFQSFSASTGVSHWEYDEDWRNRLMLNLTYSNIADLGAIYDFFLRVSVGHDWGPTEGSGSAYLDLGFSFW